MKVAHITPTSLLREVLDPNQDYHLVLTNQILGDQEYLNFYRERVAQGDYVILDNDAHELKDANQMMKIDMLNEAIDLLRPSEVVLPDKFGTGMRETLEYAQEGLDKLHKGPWAWQGVPRGKTLSEYLECAAQMIVGFPNIHCLGVYYLTEIELNIPRPMLVPMMVEKLKILGYICPDIHLLGEGRTLESMKEAQYFPPEVRGLDTAKIVNWGLEGKLVSANNIPPHRGRAKNYFSVAIADSLEICRKQIIRDNIEYWRWYCGSR